MKLVATIPDLQLHLLDLRLRPVARFCGGFTLCYLVFSVAT